MRSNSRSWKESSMTILSSDYTSNYLLSTDFDPLTIDHEVLVAGLTVMSASNVVDNFGLVFGNGEGVELANPQQDGTLINEPGALIVGTIEGITIAGGVNDTIDNLGRVHGATDRVGMNSDGSQLNNRGFIYGQFTGVLLVGGSEVIANAGVIQSPNVGIFVDTGARGPTVITNGAKGIIVGGDEAIATGNNGAIALHNRGTIVGGIDCGVPGAGDTIVNRGKITGEVFLASGDTFDGKGGISGEIFASGNDSITAGRGKASIAIMVGNDSVTAGTGHDQFIFNFVPVTGGPVETITKFNVSIDKIALSESDFVGIGPLGHPLAAGDFHIGASAKTASQHIVYNAKTGFLFYDPDGSGPMPEIHFATLSAHLAAHDFLVAP
jgi:hypothetical protein